MASASRFCEVSEDEIECLLESAIPEKTKNVLCKKSHRNCIEIISPHRNREGII